MKPTKMGGVLEDAHILKKCSCWKDKKARRWGIAGAAVAIDGWGGEGWGDRGGEDESGGEVRVRVRCHV